MTSEVTGPALLPPSFPLAPCAASHLRPGWFRWPNPSVWRSCCSRSARNCSARRRAHSPCALWLASPFVLGIGHLDGVDIPFTLATTLSAWALVRWLRLRRTRGLLWVGLALAAVADSQISGLVIVASSLTVIVGMQWRSGIRRALASAGLAGLVALVALWASYVVLAPSVLWQSPSVLPRPYLDGTAYLGSQDTVGAAGYVAGIAYTGGRWWFWPVSLVIKWPVVSLLLLVAGLVACGRLPRGVRGQVAGAVALPAVLLTVFTLMMPRDIGLRFLLPVIALWALMAGALVPATTASRPRLRCMARAGAAAARPRDTGHSLVVPALSGLDYPAVPACLHGGDGLQRRLGTGAVCAECVERLPSSPDCVFRPARYHDGRHSRRPLLARYGSGRDLRLGRRVGHRAQQFQPLVAGLAPQVVPGRSARRLDPALPLPPPAAGFAGGGPGPAASAMPRDLESGAIDRPPARVPWPRDPVPREPGRRRAGCRGPGRRGPGRRSPRHRSGRQPSRAPP